ncbi:tail assembly chaperone [Fusobacterium ulcerans]|uniref:tail assembly chaperone n=1 Tax=Fusobacterium ulcerans TaxID=861 RepID=UPI001D0B7B00|nr:tail assembly chaperone [Fusobacterium ulcerans]MCB8565161.1 tail assembly chaperone [Fusobacterium ulcerans]MCB8649164.1 tail assembly chaperone [Fusobacterium ulcerans]
MRVEINDKEYKLKLNLRTRIKLSKYYPDEIEMYKKAGMGNLEIITKIIYCSLQGSQLSYEEFLESYPDIKESYEMFYKVFQKLIEDAGNPLNIEIKEKSDIKIEEKKSEKIDFRKLIITVMSKGYKQEEVLDMTYWDINLIFEADYKHLEREVFHTNALINTIAGIVGSKETIDILERKKKEEYRDYSTFHEIGILLDKKRIN